MDDSLFTSNAQYTPAATRASKPCTLWCITQLLSNSHDCTSVLHPQVRINDVEPSFDNSVFLFGLQTYVGFI